MKPFYALGVTLLEIESLITLTLTIRASTICCIFELALKFFEQNFPIPGSTVTFDNSMSANIRMSFLSIVTDF